MFFEIKPVQSVIIVHCVGGRRCYTKLRHIFPNAIIKYFDKHSYFPPHDDYTPTMDFWQKLFYLQNQKETT